MINERGAGKGQKSIFDLKVSTYLVASRCLNILKINFLLIAFLFNLSLLSIITISIMVMVIIVKV